MILKGEPAIVDVIVISDPDFLTVIFVISPLSIFALIASSRLAAIEDEFLVLEAEVILTPLIEIVAVSVFAPEFVYITLDRNELNSVEVSDVSTKDPPIPPYSTTNTHSLRRKNYSVRQNPKGRLLMCSPNNCHSPRNHCLD